MARYTVHTAAGRKRKTIYGKTRAEVAEKLAKAVMDRADGLVFEGVAGGSSSTWSVGWPTPRATPSVLRLTKITPISCAPTSFHLSDTSNSMR